MLNNILNFVSEHKLKINTMNSEAFWMMFITYSIITGLTAYFFFKVLFSKKHHEPDSYSENDEEKN